MNKTASQSLIKKIANKNDHVNPLLFARSFYNLSSKCTSKRNSKDFLLAKYSSCYQNSKRSDGMRKSCKNSSSK
jgi:hypothetical protein